MNEFKELKKPHRPQHFNRKVLKLNKYIMHIEYINNILFLHRAGFNINDKPM